MEEKPATQQAPRFSLFSIVGGILSGETESDLAKVLKASAALVTQAQGLLKQAQALEKQVQSVSTTSPKV